MLNTSTFSETRNNFEVSTGVDDADGVDDDDDDDDDSNIVNISDTQGGVYTD